MMKCFSYQLFLIFDYRSPVAIIERIIELDFLEELQVQAN